MNLEARSVGAEPRYEAPPNGSSLAGSLLRLALVAEQHPLRLALDPVYRQL